jgi:Spy/CpxP family protein refolding chaperone
MSSSKFRETLVVATASMMTVFAVGAAAQAPAGGPPRGGGMGMGMMGPQDRPGTIERLGLNDPALKLTAAQKTEIDKIVDAYLAEQKVLAEKYPMTPGSPPSQEAMQIRRTARENLNTALGKVLNDEQRKSWEAAQAARRPQMGGPGGPPPGNR